MADVLALAIELSRGVAVGVTEFTREDPPLLIQKVLVGLTLQDLGLLLQALGFHLGQPQLGA